MHIKYPECCEWRGKQCARADHGVAGAKLVGHVEADRAFPAHRICCLHSSRGLDYPGGASQQRVRHQTLTSHHQADHIIPCRYTLLLSLKEMDAP